MHFIDEMLFEKVVILTFKMTICGPQSIIWRLLSNKRETSFFSKGTFKNDVSFCLLNKRTSHPESTYVSFWFTPQPPPLSQQLWLLHTESFFRLLSAFGLPPTPLGQLVSAFGLPPPPPRCWRHFWTAPNVIIRTTFECSIRNYIMGVLG